MVFIERMQASSSHVVRTKIASVTAMLSIVLALLSHSSLNYTLCLHVFLLLSLRLCVHQVMALAPEGMYVCTYLTITLVDGEELVCTYEWTLSDVICPASVQCRFVNCSTVARFLFF